MCCLAINNLSIYLSIYLFIYLSIYIAVHNAAGSFSFVQRDEMGPAETAATKNLANKYMFFYKN